ncbi:hypothetical protein RF11_08358 [Thelohanellus kitauei]|uniref:Uncharacterized protein n=1 Tax=Thelohanellus kitauei TaxID=669202 RepID=A0A0C2JQR5_THEKT|nr:hypothetical protein RF11_06384 [Thelohanellus kitauei]KII71723.1 hypothetical protein RF11_08358 [Thelohanellus kitauei]
MIEVLSGVKVDAYFSKFEKISTLQPKYECLSFNVLSWLLPRERMPKWYRRFSGHRRGESLAGMSPVLPLLRVEGCLALVLPYKYVDPVAIAVDVKSLQKCTSAGFNTSSRRQKKRVFLT